MFFGHEVKSNNQGKASPMTLETDVKLSQAVLDPAGKGGNNKKEPVCLMAEVAGKSFILAVLDPSQSWQCQLDLVLAAGTAVKFFLRGQGTVHITGYEIRDDMGDDLEMSMSSDSDEDEAEAPVVEKAKTPSQAKNIPVKTKAKSPANTNGVKPAAKTNGKPAPAATNQDSDEDTSDDEDFDIEDIEDDDDLEGDDDDDDDESFSDDDELSFGEEGSSDEVMQGVDDSDNDDDDDDD